MLDPMIGTSRCALCNSIYESYDKLCEHQRKAHRGLSNEEKPEAVAIVEGSETSEG